ncbi:MAG: hypothetical protein AAGA48_06195 [Myxococcota bacterium]
MTRRALAATFGGMLIVVGLGLSAAVAQNTPALITVHVPGAQTVAVYCGGEDTVHAKGEVVAFAPASLQCFIEAPWTAAMPLRGEFRVGRSSQLLCRRANMTLRCE